MRAFAQVEYRAFWVGFLCCAAHGEAGRCLGRDDEFDAGIIKGFPLRLWRFGRNAGVLRFAQNDKQKQAKATATTTATATATAKAKRTAKAKAKAKADPLWG